MNARHWDLTEALCRCVRLFTLEQAMRFTEIRDRSNFRQFLKPLEAHGYVRQVVVMAKPVPEMREPLFAWEAPRAFASAEMRDLQSDRVAVGEEWIPVVLQLARARWSPFAASPFRCVVATQRAGDLFGARKTGYLAKALQASHDLGVAEVFGRVVDEGLKVEDWQLEDFSDVRLGECIPDAVIRDSKGVAQKAVEVVGADYDEAKLRKLHLECNSRGISYELW